MVDEVTSQAEPAGPAGPPESAGPAGADATSAPVEASEPAGAIPAPAPVRDRRAPLRRTLVAIGWVAVAAGLVAGAVVAVDIVTGHHGDGRSLHAKSGDCLSGESDHDLRFVQCDDPAVKWIVVSVVERQSKQDSQQKSCRLWPEAQASYWESRNGSDGFVLCLRPVSAG